MVCPNCGNMMKQLKTSSEPEGIRKDQECPVCHNVYIMTKAHSILLRKGKTT